MKDTTRIISGRLNSFLIAAFILLSTGYIDAQNSAPDKNKLSRSAFQQTIGFKENKGQYGTLRGHSPEEFFFVADLKDFQVLVTKSGLKYLFCQYEHESDKGEMNEDVENENREVRVSKVDLDLLGSSILRENIVTEDNGHYVTHYYNADNPQGILGVKTSRSITIKDAYPGIDWHLYFTKENQLKYDFIVHPGADLSSIQLSYKGAQKISLENENHNILVESCMGKIEEQQLKCYQDGVELHSAFIKTDNVVQINCDNIQPDKDLIVDPILTWSTFYGDIEHDGPKSIWVDNGQNIYVTGYIYPGAAGLLVDLNGTAYQQVYGGGGCDMFILKFDAALTLQWMTYYGGAGNDYGNGIYTCDDSCVIFTGQTASNDFPVTDGIAYHGGTFDAFRIVFSPAGVRLFASYLGGDHEDVGQSICGQGNTYIIAGFTSSSTDFPTLALGGAYFQGYGGGTMDGFIASFNFNTNAQAWGTFFGGDLQDTIHNVVSDGLDNLYIVGNTASTNMFPVFNPGGTAYTQAFGGVTDAFIGAFNSTLGQTWCTYYGGEDDDIGYDIITVGNSQIGVAGRTWSTLFPTFDPGGGAFFSANLAGASDGFALKFDYGFARILGTYLGGAANDAAYSITGNKCGDMFFTGETFSANFPTVNPGAPDFFDGALDGVSSPFLTRLSATSVMTWSSYFDGTAVARNFARCLAASDTNIYVTGEFITPGAGVPPLLNPGGLSYFDGVAGGGDDGFVASFGSGCYYNDYNCLSINKISNPPQTYAGYPVTFSIEVCNNCNVPIDVYISDFLTNSINFILISGNLQVNGITGPISLPPGCTTFTIVGYFMEPGIYENCASITDVSGVIQNDVYGNPLTSCIEIPVLIGCPGAVCSDAEGCEVGDTVTICYCFHRSTWNLVGLEFNLEFPDWLTYTGIYNINPVISLGLSSSPIVNIGPSSYQDYDELYFLANFNSPGVTVGPIVGVWTLVCFKFTINTPPPSGQNNFPVFLDTPPAGFPYANFYFDGDPAPHPQLSQVGNLFLPGCPNCNYLDADFMITQGPCPGEVTLTATNTDPTLVHKWEYGDNLNTPNLGGGPVVTYTYPQPGTYIITHTVFANGVAGQMQQTVVISDYMIPDFSFIIKSCHVYFTDLSTASVPITAWFWDFGDGTYSNLSNPVHTYSSTGTYNVCLTIIYKLGDVICERKICKEVNNKCSDEAVCSVFAKYKYKISYCKVAFSDVSASGVTTTITGWLWDFGDGYFSTQQNPLHTFSHPGVFHVCLTVFGFNGSEHCQDTYCQDILVKDLCQPDPYKCKVNPDFAYVINGCRVNFIDLSYSGNSTTITQWDWDFGDNTAHSNLVNPIHHYAFPGTYTVCLIITGSTGFVGCHAKYCLDIVIDEACMEEDCYLDADFNYVINGCNIILVDATQTAANTTIDNWTWTLGNGSMITGTDFVNYYYGGGGNYPVCLTVTGHNSNLSCFDSICKDVEIPHCHHREEMSYGRDMIASIIPNPSEGNFKLSILSTTGDQYEVIIVDVLGRVVEKRHVTVVPGVNDFNFNLSSLAKGIYSIGLSTSTERISFKLVIE